MKKNHLKFYYGWVIVFIAGLSVFFSAPGQSYSISAFIDSYIEEFKFSRTTVSLIYSIATVISGSLLVHVGKAVDKHGQRIMTAIVGIMLAITCFYNSMITNIFLMSFGFFLLRYFGQGSLTLIPSSLIPQWFDKRRAFAISLANIGGVLANTLVPIINVYLITNYTWQNAWRFWGLALIVIFVPLAYFLIVNKPEDIGLLPDNQAVENEDALKNEIIQMEKDSWNLSEARRTKEFWFVGIISMLAPMISTGLMIHYYSIMELRGISKEHAALIVGLMAIPGFVMPIISGLIIDKYRSKHIITATLITIIIGLVIFVSTTSYRMAAAFLVIYGFAINIQNVTINVIWPRYYGRKYLGSIRGAATVFMVIGSALGPVPFGLSFDMTGSYTPVFITMIIITFISTGLAISIKKPQRSY